MAVKVIRAEHAQEDQFRHRFTREVAAARRVGGAWTAPVIDADTEAAVPWVATGYVPGPDLHTVVKERYGPLSEASLLALAQGLAGALKDIHGAGLIHRDLKPSNVLVTVNGPRVIDFGIARAIVTLTGQALTRTGAVVGSPGFMSPEQARGQRLAPASDVFCLGSVLVYAATGRSPFGAPEAGPHALMFRVVEEEPDWAGVPSAVRDLVEPCLAKDPAERPGVADLIDAIAAVDGAADPWLPATLLAQLGREAAHLLNLDGPPDVPSPNLDGPPDGPEDDVAQDEAVEPEPKTPPLAEPRSVSVGEAVETAPTVPVANAPATPATPRRLLRGPRGRILLGGALALSLGAALVPLRGLLDHPGGASSAKQPSALQTGTPRISFTGAWERDTPGLGGTFGRIEIGADSKPGGNPARILFTDERGSVLCHGRAEVIERSAGRLVLGSEEITSTTPAGTSSNQCPTEERQTFTTQKNGTLQRKSGASHLSQDATEWVRASAGSQPVDARFLGAWTSIDYDQPSFRAKTFEHATINIYQGRSGSVAAVFKLTQGPRGAVCEGEVPLLSAKKSALRFGPPARLSEASTAGCAPTAVAWDTSASDGAQDEITLMFSGETSLGLNRS